MAWHTSTVHRFLFMVPILSSDYITIIFNLSLVDGGHLDSVLFRALKCIAHFHVQSFLWTYVFACLDKFLGVELLCHLTGLFLIF
jgi:hypothetical protein